MNACLCMNWPIVVALGAQLLFSISDFMGRYYMSRFGFTPEAFLSWWFVVYMLIRTIATIGQLYIFSTLELGKTIAVFAAFGLLIANVAGFFLLGEVLSWQAYLAIVLVMLALALLAVYWSSLDMHPKPLKTNCTLICL